MRIFGARSCSHQSLPEARIHQAARFPVRRDIKRARGHLQLEITPGSSPTPSIPKGGCSRKCWRQKPANCSTAATAKTTRTLLSPTRDC